jgi:hypothetical protein
MVGDCVGLKENGIEGLEETVLSGDHEAVGDCPGDTVPETVELRVWSAEPVPVILDVWVLVIVLVGVTVD